MNAPLLHYTQTEGGLDAVRRMAAHVVAGMRQDSNNAWRADTVPTVEGATAFLARELQYVSAKVFEVIYNPLKGRELVPLGESVPQGAETYAYDMWDFVGDSKFMAQEANQFPKVDVKRNRYAFPLRDIGVSYSYTDQDLAASAFAGKRLDTMRARAARMKIEQQIDDLIAFGDSVRGIRGLAGQTDFTAVSPVTGSWSTATTPAQIFADLNKLVQAPEQATAGFFVADTLVLPLSVAPLLAAPWSTTYNPMTIEAAWLQTQAQRKNSQGVPIGIKQIEYWNRLNLANAGGTGGRALSYKKDNMVLEQIHSYDYREFIEPSSGLIFEVKAKARLGGLSVKYPLATAYMDIQ